MEVSGRKLAENSSTITPPCDHCAIINEDASSSCYCTECNEFLCTRCQKQHIISTASISHSLLAEHDMPERKLSFGNINVCPKDGDIVKFYCEIHKMFICVTCLSVDHGKCGAQAIKALAKNFETSQVYRSLKSNLNHLLGQIGGQKDYIDDIKSDMTKHVSNALSEIQSFRSDLNTRLDALETEIRTELERLETKNDELLSLQEKKLTAIETELSELVSRINEQETFRARELLVISTVKAKLCLQQHRNGLEYIVKKLDEIRKENILFVKNDELESMAYTSTLGSLERTGEAHDKQTAPWTGEYVCQIDIKHPDDTRDCWITGCTEMDEDIFAITDNNNSNLKIVDIEYKSIDRCLALPVKPWDVTRITCMELVVTSDDRLIFIKASLRQDFSIEREAPIDGVCSGIKYTQGKLVVSFTEPGPAIKILNMNGHVLQTILEEGTPENPLIAPFYVTTGPTTSDIYVADYDLNKILWLDKNGTIKESYFDEHLAGPYGMAIGDEYGVLLAGCRSANVHQINGHCGQIRITLDIDDGIEVPQAISYCKESGKLVISHNQLLAQRSIANTLSIYKLHRDH